MRWTKRKPTEPDWYWVRLREHDRPEVAWVDGKGGIYGVWGPLTLSGYEWAGPLPRPTEATSRHSDSHRGGGEVGGGL